MNKVILIFRFLFWGLEAAFLELIEGRREQIEEPKTEYKAV